MLRLIGESLAHYGTQDEESQSPGSCTGGKEEQVRKNSRNKAVEEAKSIICQPHPVLT